MKISRLLFAACCCSVLVAPAAPAEDAAAVIARARAFLGSEEAIGKLQSVHYTGMLEAVGSKGAKPARAAVEVIFQKPYRQRMVITIDQKTQITGLDGYNAWRLDQDKADAARPRWVFLPPEQVRSLRANTWENLACYQGLELVGGRIEDGGETVIDGKPCRKLTFRHPDGIFFIRYFDPKTGQLLLTESEDGTLIREEGEIQVNGLKFPRKIINTSKSSDAVQTIVFDKITTNEVFDAKLFAVPATR